MIARVGPFEAFWTTFCPRIFPNPLGAGKSPGGDFLVSFVGGPPSSCVQIASLTSDHPEKSFLSGFAVKDLKSAGGWTSGFLPSPMVSGGRTSRFYFRLDAVKHEARHSRLASLLSPTPDLPPAD